MEIAACRSLPSMGFFEELTRSRPLPFGYPAAGRRFYILPNAADGNRYGSVDAVGSVLVTGSATLAAALAVVEQPATAATGAEGADTARPAISAPSVADQAVRAPRTRPLPRTGPKPPASAPRRQSVRGRIGLDQASPRQSRGGLSAIVRSIESSAKKRRLAPPFG